MSKRNLTTPGQRYVDKIKRDRAANEEAAKLASDRALQNTNIIQSDVAPSTEDVTATIARIADIGLELPKQWTPSQIDAIQAKLGRKLSEAEKAVSMIARPASTLSAFTPIGSVEVSAIDAEIADAEAAIEAEKLSKMSVAELRLYTAKKLKDDQAASLISEQVRQQHLADNKEQLHNLNALRCEALADPDFTSNDLTEIDNAIRQLSLPGGDADVTAHLLGRVGEIQAEKVDNQKAAVAAKLKAAGLTESEVTEAVARRFPAETKPAEAEKPIVVGVDAAFNMFHTAMDTLRATQKRRDEVLASNGADSTEYKAALSESHKAGDIAWKADRAYEAAKAAAAESQTA